MRNEEGRQKCSRHEGGGEGACWERKKALFTCTNSEAAAMSPMLFVHVCFHEMCSENCSHEKEAGRHAVWRQQCAPRATDMFMSVV